MDTTVVPAQRPLPATQLVAGLVLLVAGFCGHFLAARAIGGSYVAFRDHIGGYFLIAIVTGALIFGLGWRVWRRGRWGVAFLVFSLVQAVLGGWVYLHRFDMLH